MGTPRFAVPSLKALAQSRHQLIAVVTNPDRPQGRGRQLASPPVKEQALKLGLEVLQPAAVNDPSLAAVLAARAPDLFVVVAFSILPRHLLAIPRLGSINLHPSLLPAYRGAAPIIWAVANGEEETGITTFQLSPRIDAGHILLQRRFAIGCDETAGELEARLCVEGAKMVVETVDGLEEGRLTGRPQGTKGISRAPKLTKEDGQIDWHQPAERVRNLVRSMNPTPGTYTHWQDKMLKVHRTQHVEGCGAPGTVLCADGRRGLTVACGEGALQLTQVQPAGKAAMEGTAFVRGYPIAAGMRLG